MLEEYKMSRSLKIAKRQEIRGVELGRVSSLVNYT